MAGDVSFAQVAASAPAAPMGDRGGGGVGFRGGHRGFQGLGGVWDSDRGHGRNLVWQRDFSESSGNSFSHSGLSSRLLEDRGEAVAAGRNKFVDKAPIPSAQRRAASPGSGNEMHCMNCHIVGHFTAVCPTIRCEKCKKLGHIAQICQTVLPWECVAAMCGFQSPGQGFFYFPDTSSGKQSKTRANSVVITVLEGKTTTKALEDEFNGFLSTTWHYTARAISPSQFIM